MQPPDFEPNLPTSRQYIHPSHSPSHRGRKAQKVARRKGSRTDLRSHRRSSERRCIRVTQTVSQRSEKLPLSPPTHRNHNHPRQNLSRKSSRQLNVTASFQMAADHEPSALTSTIKQSQSDFEDESCPSPVVQKQRTPQFQESRGFFEFYNRNNAKSTDEVAPRPGTSAGLSVKQTKPKTLPPQIVTNDIAVVPHSRHNSITSSIASHQLFCLTRPQSTLSIARAGKRLRDFVATKRGQTEAAPARPSSTGAVKIVPIINRKLGSSKSAINKLKSKSGMENLRGDSAPEAVLKEDSMSARTVVLPTAEGSPAAAEAALGNETYRQSFISRLSNHSREALAEYDYVAALRQIGRDEDSDHLNLKIEKRHSLAAATAELRTAVQALAQDSSAANKPHEQHATPFDKALPKTPGKCQESSATMTDVKTIKLVEDSDKPPHSAAVNAPTPGPRTSSKNVKATNESGPITKEPKNSMASKKHKLRSEGPTELSSDNEVSRSASTATGRTVDPKKSSSTLSMIESHFQNNDIRSPREAQFDHAEVSTSPVREGVTTPAPSEKAPSEPPTGPLPELPEGHEQLEAERAAASSRNSTRSKRSSRRNELHEQYRLSHVRNQASVTSVASTVVHSPRRAEIADASPKKPISIRSSLSAPTIGSVEVDILDELRKGGPRSPSSIYSNDFGAPLRSSRIFIGRDRGAIKERDLRLAERARKENRLLEVKEDETLQLIKDPTSSSREGTASASTTSAYIDKFPAVPASRPSSRTSSLHGRAGPDGPRSRSRSSITKSMIVQTPSALSSIMTWGVHSPGATPTTAATAGSMTVIPPSPSHYSRHSSCAPSPALTVLPGDRTSIRSNLANHTHGHPDAHAHARVPKTKQSKTSMRSTISHSHSTHTAVSTGMNPTPPASAHSESSTPSSDEEGKGALGGSTTHEKIQSQIRSSRASQSSSRRRSQHSTTSRHRHTHRRHDSRDALIAEMTREFKQLNIFLRTFLLAQNNHSNLALRAAGNRYSTGSSSGAESRLSQAPLLSPDMTELIDDTTATSTATATCTPTESKRNTCILDSSDTVLRAHESENEWRSRKRLSAVAGPVQAPVWEVDSRGGKTGRRVHVLPFGHVSTKSRERLL